MAFFTRRNLIRPHEAAPARTDRTDRTRPEDASEFSARSVVCSVKLEQGEP